MQADKNLDPRYEFCAPRYHDFTSSRDDDPSNEEREKLDADEWFTLLNAGLIDTDLTTPRSRTCRSSSTSISSVKNKHDADVAGRKVEVQSKGGGLADVFDNLGSENDEDDLFVQNEGDKAGVENAGETCGVIESTKGAIAKLGPPQREKKRSKSPQRECRKEDRKRVKFAESADADAYAYAGAPPKAGAGVSFRQQSNYVNSAARQNQACGPHKVKTFNNTSITIPQSPMLNTKRRASARLMEKRTVVAFEKDTTLALVKNIKSVRRCPPMLDSPAFRTRSRARRRAKSMEPRALAASLGHKEIDTRRSDALGLQSKKIAKRKAAKRRHTTSFEPFKLQTETRGTKKKKELIKIIEEEEIEAKQLHNRFKAREVPDPFDLLHFDMRVASADGPKVKSPTQPKPFNLRSQQLHMLAQKDLENKRNARAEQEKRMSTQFKARPYPSLSTKRQPFKPVTNQNQNKKPVSTLQVKLRSSSRAEQRKCWNETQQARRIQLEKEKEEKKLLEIEEEMRELKKLRKTMEFKARPLPRYLR